MAPKITRFARRAAAAILPFAIAAVIVAIATGLKLLAGSWLAEDPSVMFLGAVALVAWRLGARAGIFAAVLSALTQGFWFIAPESFFVATPAQAVSLAIWGAEAILVCVLFGAMTRAKTRALHAAALEADQAQLVLRATTADASNRAKSEFLANMSHEIRTPITAILGFGELLQDAELSPKERADHVHVIQRSAKHLLGLIDDILDLSKIEADKMEMERVPCSPRRTIVDVVSLLRVPALEKSLSLRVVYATAMPATIQCDPTRLRQILMNLVSNAIKFTSKGGVTLTLRCSDPSGPSPRLAFEIVDTGRGIAHDKLQHVFEPFSQADASTTRKFGGTGLGLTISSRLAQALGGSLTLASELGVGSTFTLDVPTGALTGVPMLADEEEAGNSDPTPAKVAFAGLAGRVLLAEDGPDNQALISAYLRRAGASVIVAENGRIAVDRALAARVAGVPFDLILMDMQMPELDGYGATQTLRDAGYTGPIVALTAHAMVGDRERCIAAGCSDYLVKPIVREAFGALLQRHLPRKGEPLGALVSAFADDEETMVLVGTFVRNLPKQVATITVALTDGDLDGLRRAVHQLRGAAGGYGFFTLTEAAASVENAIAEGADLLKLAPLTHALTGLCRTVRATAAASNA
jgi:signal transduction histidine kinase/CheY-like chemotaxis protein/HPt (histidine-containing phosphotransfer) domain-containing protein